MGEASPIPDLFYWALWVPAFFVVLWGMLLLFGPRARPPFGPRARPSDAEEKPQSGEDKRG